MTLREDHSTFPFWLNELAEPGRWRLGLGEAFLETVAEPLVALELSTPGTRVGRAEAFGFLHTATRTLDLRAPYGLELLAVNPAALHDAGLVRLSPYHRGWLVEVHIVAGETG